MEKPSVIAASSKNPRGGLLRTLVLILLAGFGCMVFLVCLTMPRPPKESDVIQNFYKNRSAFEQLRDMLEEDSRLRRVAGSYVETSNPFYLGGASASGFPMDRYGRYLALLKQVGGYVATRDEGEHCDPGVVVWAWGWAGNTRHMGIRWIEETSTNQISAPGIVFKHIDENWYLWCDY